MSTAPSFIVKQDPQPGEPAFDKWRNLDMEQAKALVATPSWATAQDEFGRNAVMNALYCFSRPPLVCYLLDEAVNQGVLADLCKAEDFVGVRLPAYALREALRGLAHGKSWSKALFQHGVCNSKGQGLLAQLRIRNRLDDPEVAHGSFLLRGIGFGYSDLDHLSVNDWQAGLNEDDFVKCWSQQVLINEAPAGVAYTLDMDAFRAWLMPLYRSTSKKDWSPALANCLNLIDTAEALIDLHDDERRQAETLIREAALGLRLLLSHEPPTHRHSLIPYILFYRDWGVVWEGFLANEQAACLQSGTVAAQNLQEPRRI